MLDGGSCIHTKLASSKLLAKCKFLCTPWPINLVCSWTVGRVFEIKTAFGPLILETSFPRAAQLVGNLGLLQAKGRSTVLWEPKEGAGREACRGLKKRGKGRLLQEACVCNCWLHSVWVQQSCSSWRHSCQHTSLNCSNCTKYANGWARLRIPAKKWEQWEHWSTSTLPTMNV